MVLGNHEFDRGPNFWKTVLRAANFLFCAPTCTKKMVRP